MIAAAVLGALAGWVVAGVPGAGAGLAGGLAWPRVAARRRRAARARTLTTQLPDVLRALAAAVRAGRSIPQALEAARDEALEPAREALDAALARIDVGASTDDALDVFARTAGIPEADAVVETIRIARDAGGELPAVLDVAVAAMIDRARIARDRRAASAQARMSAAVVAGMPFAFLVVAGPAARTQMSILIREPIGWVLLGIGLGLQGAGFVWMRRLLRARPA